MKVLLAYSSLIFAFRYTEIIQFWYLWILHWHWRWKYTKL